MELEDNIIGEPIGNQHIAGGDEPWPIYMNRLEKIIFEDMDDDSVIYVSRCEKRICNKDTSVVSGVRVMFGKCQVILELYEDESTWVTVLTLKQLVRDGGASINPCEGWVTRNYHWRYLVDLFYRIEDKFNIAILDRLDMNI